MCVVKVMFLTEIERYFKECFFAPPQPHEPSQNIQNEENNKKIKIVIKKFQKLLLIILLRCLGKTYLIHLSKAENFLQLLR